MKKYFGILMILALLAAPAFADSQADAEISVTVNVSQYAEIDFDEDSLSLTLTDRDRENTSTTFTVLANFDHDVQITSQGDPDWQGSETSPSVAPFLVNGAGENGDLTLAYLAYVFEGESTDSSDMLTPFWGSMQDEKATLSFEGGTPGETNTFTLMIGGRLDENYLFPGTYSGEDTLAIADTYEGELTFSVVAK